ncbi:hypothetical protein [Sulfitobacter mediterraneus]|uniref:Lipoprotein n=1 Tax=Sulfitobacter mediterraneus TaxID=83219 RepID=A0A2T6CDW5_9RHOB|nr:hypothetical protein [Sulfitobacter mediterraneus]PTX73699.1 hypothetical protein C8N31_106163 [Sulfitobacter mediterraneus]
MNKHKFIIVTVIGLSLAASMTQAATCAPREALVKKLEKKYSEELIARGLQSRTSLMEVFASSKSGTYTVLITNPLGLSCVVSAGTDWLVEDASKNELGTAG